MSAGTPVIVENKLTRKYFKYGMSGYFKISKYRFILRAAYYFVSIVSFDSVTRDIIPRISFEIFISQNLKNLFLFFKDAPNQTFKYTDEGSIIEKFMWRNTYWRE